MAFRVAGCQSVSLALNIDLNILQSQFLCFFSLSQLGSDQLQCRIIQKNAWMNNILPIIKMGLSDRCSSCVGGHHRDGGGCGWDEGGAAMSCGGSAPRWRRIVLGKRRAVSVWLPQRLDSPSCWSGDLQEVQQVRSLFGQGQCPLRCHLGR